MKITKMHGLGNDFILTEEQPDDPSACAKALCARRISVGADGLILIGSSSQADIRMRIFNADGSEAEMCGNGIRCFARYVYDRHIVSSPTMTVQTNAGIMRPALILDDSGVVEGVRVDMGMPGFDAADIPVDAEDPLTFNIPVAGRLLAASSVLMGVPHTVLFMGPISEEEILALGPQIEANPLFPKKTNVNFVEVVGPDTLRVRTWERGAARTMACGTGSCASAVVAYKKHLTGPKVTARLDAGELEIEVARDGRVYMTGPAAYVFDGETVCE